MNKTTKGALGAAAAAALLMGGVGSLAYWSDDAMVNGGSVNSGNLTIDPIAVAPNTTACDPAWKHTNGPKVGAAVTSIVPGDVITKSCTFVIGAKGDNLSATPPGPPTVGFTATPKTGAAAPTTTNLPVAATYTLGTTALGATQKITEADGGKTLTARIQVSFPYDAAAPAGKNLNDTQNVLFTLNDLTVKLVQDNKGA